MRKISLVALTAALSLLGVYAVPLAADLAQAPSSPAMVGRKESGDMVMGKSDAKVTLIEYASLTCPYCASFHTGTLPQLKSTYIDTGLVKYVYRDFPLDSLALQAAMLPHCAGPERYFGFLDVLFRQQSTWAKADRNEATAALRRLAKLGGMTDASFDACLKNQDIQKAILETSLKGEREHQVRSTPTVLIDGKRHNWTGTFEDLDRALRPLTGRS